MSYVCVCICQLRDSRLRVMLGIPEVVRERLSHEANVLASPLGSLRFEDLENAIRSLPLHSEEDSDGTQKPNKKYYVMKVEHRTATCTAAFHMIDELLPLVLSPPSSHSNSMSPKPNSGSIKLHERLRMNPPSWEFNGIPARPLSASCGDELHYATGNLHLWAFDSNIVQECVRRGPMTQNWSRPIDPNVARAEKVKKEMNAYDDYAPQEDEEDEKGDDADDEEDDDAEVP
jgi:hypothetical protein